MATVSLSLGTPVTVTWSDDGEDADAIYGAAVKVVVPEGTLRLVCQPDGADGLVGNTDEPSAPVYDAQATDIPISPAAHRRPNGLLAAWVSMGVAEGSGDPLTMVVTAYDG